ncbi:hypothetical protein DP939_24660 [Spongiactinospora rosea]|uniref:Uncharacterized protein n=1 Tax=Spongiactinospora rosea TaxID=2248750 RepID=A0A366LUB9_9ACTN|nr:hypothetical protein DP939_24660 [Spongiactinospora rosea]
MVVGEGAFWSALNSEYCGTWETPGTRALLATVGGGCWALPYRIKGRHGRAYRITSAGRSPAWERRLSEAKAIVRAVARRPAGGGVVVEEGAFSPVLNGEYCGTWETPGTGAQPDTGGGGCWALPYWSMERHGRLERIMSAGRSPV